jgi:hypothetical protein
MMIWVLMGAIWMDMVIISDYAFVPDRFYL